VTAAGRRERKPNAVGRHSRGRFSALRDKGCSLTLSLSLSVARFPLGFAALGCVARITARVTTVHFERTYAPIHERLSPAWKFSRLRDSGPEDERREANYIPRYVYVRINVMYVREWAIDDTRYTPRRRV